LLKNTYNTEKISQKNSKNSQKSHLVSDFLSSRLFKLLKKLIKKKVLRSYKLILFCRRAEKKSQSLRDNAVCSRNVMLMLFAFHFQFNGPALPLSTAHVIRELLSFKEWTRFHVIFPKNFSEINEEFFTTQIIILLKFRK